MVRSNPLRPPRPAPVRPLSSTEWCGRGVSRRPPRRWHLGNHRTSVNRSSTWEEASTYSNGHRRVSHPGEGDGGLHLYLHEDIEQATGDTIGGTGISSSGVAGGPAAPARAVGRRHEWCGEQDHAGGHALATSALSRVLPVGQRVSRHPRWHAVRWHRMHRILMGKLLFNSFYKTFICNYSTCEQRTSFEKKLILNFYPKLPGRYCCTAICPPVVGTLKHNLFLPDT